ncbi:PurB Adenylosuccinate lyase [uncultured Caudovirales phage]|uniref:PurB Adenylosuccinate lyase n=1 Tax=uncultured Caudovirales phage TaxID=2100421 RepID=A0A6J5NXS0_9CAUD|nr:PurB Adenylosuccinate lyase [uncultured Caudovirales phage]
MIKRYENEAIRDIFSKKTLYEIYWIIENNNLRLHKRDFDIHNFRIDDDIPDFNNTEIEKILDIENKTKHETNAFVNYFANLNLDNSLHVHRDLTSSDLIDSATMIQMSFAHYLLRSKVEDLANKIDLRKRSAPEVLIMSRTHGQHALPIKIQNLFDQWLGYIDTWIQDAKEQKFYVKISGPVGNQTELQAQLEKELARYYQVSTIQSLSLRAQVTQILPRTLYSKILFNLVSLATILEKIALDVRLHSQTGIEEIFEPFTEDQSGSSSMPNKRNPILSENICGLARILRSYMSAALENVATWNHRDISHSSVERIIIPDSYHLLMYMVKNLEYVMSNLILNLEIIERNLSRTTDMTIDFQIYLKETGFPHELAYKLAKKISQESKTEQEFWDKAQFYGFTKL